MVVHPPYCIHRYFAVVVYLMKSLPTEVRERKCEMWSKVIAEWLDIYYSSNQYLISPSLWILVVVRRGCCCECATQDSLSSFVVLSSFSDVPSLIHWFIVNPYLLLPPLSSISVVSIVSSGNSVSHRSVNFSVDDRLILSSCTCLLSLLVVVLPVLVSILLGLSVFHLSSVYHHV
jgi:hypothetical protein